MTYRAFGKHNMYRGPSACCRKALSQAMSLIVLLALESCSRQTPKEARDAAYATAAHEYFPSDYDSSRQRFRDTCAEVMLLEKGSCTRYRIGSAVDQDLTIDQSYVTRGNDRLLILQSGLHGVEAFAGAAVQRLVLERYLEPLLASGWDVLIVHAANPYGFRYLRRVDEFNVDLNRNFSVDGTLYSTRNDAYVALRGIAEPPGQIANVDRESAALAARTLAAFVRHGLNFSYISNGTHAGQYQFPQGFEYGGAKPEEQTDFLRTEAARLMSGHKGTILFLDLHTGLGPSGTLTMIGGLNWPASRTDHMAAWIASLGRPDIVFENPTKGAFQTSGDVIDFVPSLIPGGRVIAVTLEYGTIGDSVSAELETNSRMILENQAHFHGCVNAETCRLVKDRFVVLFNPDELHWRQGVLGKAAAVLNSVLTEHTRDQLDAAAGR